MPATPYAKILVSVNAAGAVDGGLDIPSDCTIDFIPESIVGWLRCRWEIFDYPEGWATPSGWTLDTDGTIYSTDFYPDQITMPSNEDLWGVWMPRLLVNEQIDDSENILEGLLDYELTALCMLSPGGLRSSGAREKQHFTTSTTRVKGFIRSYQRNLIALETLANGGLTETVVVWAPEDAPSTQATSVLNELDETTDAVETLLHEIDIADESTVDLTATVVGRSDDGDHWRGDVEALVERTAGVLTELEASATSRAYASNPVGWTARWIADTDKMGLWCKGGAGKNVTWGLLANAQAVAKPAVAPSFDLDTLPWDAVWKEPYTGSPWTDDVNGYLLSEGTNPPAAGAPIGGVACASADGVNDKLSTTEVGSDFYTDVVGSFFCVYRAVAADLPAAYGAGAADALGDPGFWSDDGAYFKIAINATDIKIYVNDGTAVGITLPAPADGIHAIQVVWTGGVLYARLDSDPTWSFIACGPIGNVATVGHVFRNHAAAFGKFDIRELRWSKTAISFGEFDDCIVGTNATYGLSL